MSILRKKRPFATVLSQEGGAVQSDRAETNINNIMAKYRSTGTLPAVRSREPLYGDFTGASDLLSAFERSTQASERFMALPSAVRAEASNDPVLFLEMFDDEHGRAALVEAGLEIFDVDSGDPPPPGAEPVLPAPQQPPAPPAAPPETPGSDPALNTSST